MACYVNMREHVYLGVFGSVNGCKSCNNNKILSAMKVFFGIIIDGSFHKKSMKYVFHNVLWTHLGN